FVDLGSCFVRVALPPPLERVTRRDWGGETEVDGSTESWLLIWTMESHRPPKLPSANGSKRLSRQDDGGPPSVAAGAAAARSTVAPKRVQPRTSAGRAAFNRALIWRFSGWCPGRWRARRSTRAYRRPQGHRRRRVRTGSLRGGRWRVASSDRS